MLNPSKSYVCVRAQLLQLCPTPTQQTISHWAPLFVGFSRQEYWSGLPCPPLGDLPDLGIKSTSACVSCIVGGIFTHGTTQEDQNLPT